MNQTEEQPTGCRGAPNLSERLTQILRRKPFFVRDMTGITVSASYSGTLPFGELHDRTLYIDLHKAAAMVDGAGDEARIALFRPRKNGGFDIDCRHSTQGNFREFLDSSNGENFVFLTHSEFTALLGYAEFRPATHGPLATAVLEIAGDAICRIGPFPEPISPWGVSQGLTRAQLLVFDEESESDGRATWAMKAWPVTARNLTAVQGRIVAVVDTDTVLELVDDERFRLTGSA